MFFAPLKLTDQIVVPYTVPVAAVTKTLPHRQPIAVVAPTAPVQDVTRPSPLSLGHILVDMGLLSTDDLVRALALQKGEGVGLGDALLAHGMVRESDLLRARSRQWGASLIDPVVDPADARLIDSLDVTHCLKLGLLPWRRAGATTVVATSRPETFARHEPMLHEIFGRVSMAIASEGSIQQALVRARADTLNRIAETRVIAADSAREWNLPVLRRRLMVGSFALIAFAILAPNMLVALLTLWTILTLSAGTALKLATLAVQVPALRQARAGGFVSRRHVTTLARLPRVSVMVPLYHESDIAPRLIARLTRLTYPRELTDVLLVVEADDKTTQAALAEVKLPPWMRIVVTPCGQIKTKPRALNFALDFCRGSIIGVWDAEDAPEPDQLFHVVRRFAESTPDVACLQGVLDFYNPRTNWMSRCFAIEYATWFRVMLPGLRHLGLPVPLGGTTLFFRRNVLEELGGWDAHNVTEDADLGIRLARRGYRTELLDTVTGEEANCRILPWVRQRSRWLKGYAMTYGVHMRRPRRLLADLGWWRFAGFQVLFLGTLTQSLLAPLLWSLWIISLGITHPLQLLLPPAALLSVGLLFLLNEAVAIATALWALSGPRHRYLSLWIPALHVYFPLGAFAAWKGLAELIMRPFYWDKTSHGKFDCEAK